MNIDASLFFETGLGAIKSAVRCLCALPEALRPTRHSQGEDEVGRPIGDVEEYLASMKGGPFLRGRGGSYDFIATECSCHLDVDPILARDFMARMTAAAPVFGYACASEELLHRNRLSVEIDGGKGGRSHDWVGRDHTKCVPGLYWLTLLTEAFAERHRVPLEAVAMAALEHVELGGGQHLFRFYDHPDDWRDRTDAMDDLCARLPGVFNVKDVRPLAARGVMSFSELEGILLPWRRQPIRRS